MSRLHVGACLLAFLVAASITTPADAKGKAKSKKPKKPTTSQTAEPKPELPEFDKQAAVSAIDGIDLQKCRATNAERGEGHVTITFAPAGSAKAATVDKGPWVGTPVAKCMAGQFKKAKVPAFKGDPITVGKSFRFE